MVDINISAVQSYVEKLFKEQLPEGISYHDLDHTQYVAGQARVIGKESGLTETEQDIAETAAWFHDIGFLFSTEDHETESQKMAREYLSSNGISAEVIDHVHKCIEATRMPQDPKDDLIASVVCDADMSYLSEDFYIERTMLLRAEWNHTREKKISKKNYYLETIELFNNHKFYTEYASHNLGQGKHVNFQLLLERLSRMSDKSNKNLKKMEFQNKKLNQKLQQEKLPGRGVESMFRLTARNQINLSSIADNKANILISINSIILTVLVSMGVSRVADYPNFIIPGIVFLSTCLITIIFAILSTRPKISSGKFTEEDIHNKKVNLLFFGNFYNMTMNEYEWAVKEMMKDNNYLYTSMIRDQYSLGKVIGRKYNLLRVAYTVFMVGLIISSILFAIFILAVPNAG
ncbi:MAG: Pycsar system effector family protein [Bacteroidales bacterium]